jgi:FkbM family methyltransferase
MEASPIAERDLSNKLETLLSESVESAINRSHNKFDEVAGPLAKSIVLFGAGGLGRRILSVSRRLGIEVIAFTDNNSALWGDSIEGLPVLSPNNAAARFSHSAVFIISSWNVLATDQMRDKIRQFTELGCVSVVPFGYLFWKYADAFLPHYPLDLPHRVIQQRESVRKAFRLWADQESRRVYLGELDFRLSMNFDSVSSSVPNHYFPPDLFLFSSQEVFIDCGAFDGDTIGDFVSRRGDAWRRVIAFEPDPLNWSRLCATTKMLPGCVQNKIILRNQAIGSRNGSVQFDATGTDLAAVGRGTLNVECVRLDDALAEDPPTFIKLDIEGYEIDALIGGREVIAENLPILAISSYHQQSHLREIPLFVSSLSDRYRFFLRPHGTEAWDMVCYAVPSSRLAVKENVGMAANEDY